MKFEMMKFIEIVQFLTYPSCKLILYFVFTVGQNMHRSPATWNLDHKGDVLANKTVYTNYSETHHQNHHH